MMILIIWLISFIRWKKKKKEYLYLMNMNIQSSQHIDDILDESHNLALYPSMVAVRIDPP